MVVKQERQFRPRAWHNGARDRTTLCLVGSALLLLLSIDHSTFQFGQIPRDPNLTHIKKMSARYDLSHQLPSP
jgi:hypothetical protein